MSSRNTNIYLHIAGFLIEFNFLPKDAPWEKYGLLQEIRSEYKDLIKPPPSHVDYRIEVGIIPIVRSLATKVVHKNHSETYLIVLFEDDGKRIRVAHHISFMQLQFIILKIIQKLLIKHDGFILHCSVSIVKNKAYLFLGKSGAGKSTAMTLLNKTFPAFTDDSAFIRYKRGSFYCYQTHMIEKNDWIKKTSDSFRISRVFILHKSKSVRLQPITQIEDVQSLLFQQLWTMKTDIHEQIKLFDKFTQLKNTFFNLWFNKKENDLVDYISFQVD